MQRSKAEEADPAESSAARGAGVQRWPVPEVSSTPAASARVATGLLSSPGGCSPFLAVPSSVGRALPWPCWGCCAEGPQSPIVTPTTAPHHPAPHRCPEHSHTTGSHGGFIWRHRPRCTVANKDREGIDKGRVPHTLRDPHARRGGCGIGTDRHTQTEVQTPGRRGGSHPHACKAPAAAVHVQRKPLRTPHT